MCDYHITTVGQVWKQGGHLECNKTKSIQLQNLFQRTVLPMQIKRSH